MIQCACGCGTWITERDKKNRPHKFVSGHNSFHQFGEKSHTWKGGVLKKTRGYTLIRLYGHPYGDKKGYVYLHRLVVEEYLGRYLHPDEKVHHKDGNTDNNNIENLEIMSQAEHLSLHRKKGDCVGGHP